MKIQKIKYGYFLLLGALTFYLSGSILFVPGKECCHIKPAKKIHSCCSMEKEMEPEQCPAKENPFDYKLSTCGCLHNPKVETEEVTLTPKSDSFKSMLSCICIFESSIELTKPSIKQSEMAFNHHFNDTPIFLTTGTFLI